MPILGKGAARDRKVLEEIDVILNSLWPPLRFLTDLRTVWADLEPEEQREIESSRPFQDQFHESLARGYVHQLSELTPQIGSGQYRVLRDELTVFLEHWDDQEPDRIKVFSSMIRNELEASGRKR